MNFKERIDQAREVAGSIEHGHEGVVRIDLISEAFQMLLSIVSDMEAVASAPAHKDGLYAGGSMRPLTAP